MSGGQRGTWRRRLLLATATYATLWGITALRGSVVAEDSIAIHCTGSRETPRVEELHDDLQVPWIMLSSSALAPFLVSVEYDYTLGPLWGAGGTAFVLWLPGRTWVLGERLRWIS